ncbi:unnamed protein product [Porites evermanni]|uniref:Secreted protein n=1 Tax=Porites evermanni TaxID=104178 RepID=A0ABN8NAR7_9CNID|nr:unnamed protein product [Porites evermanni]
MENGKIALLHKLLFFHLGRTTAKKCITAYNYIFFYFISKTCASSFIRGSKHLETIKELCLLSVSRCLEPLMRSSHLFFIYYFLLLL